MVVHHHHHNQPQHSFIQRFKDIVHQYPNNVALHQSSLTSSNSSSSNSSSDDIKLTYQELDKQSSLLQSIIIDHIVKDNNNNNNDNNNNVIGVLSEPSIDLIVSLLAILKTSLHPKYQSIYLPLDATSLPNDRLSYIISNSNCSIILVQHQYHHLSESSSIFINNEILNISSSSSSSPIDKKILCIDCLLKQQQQFNVNELSSLSLLDTTTTTSSLLLDRPAYLIYTSGSTGLPKGVLVSHRGIDNFIQEQIRQFQLSPGDRLLQSLPICFDASLSEIGTTLLSGSTLIIPRSPKDMAMVRASTDTLLQCIQDMSVTCIMLAPSLLSHLSPDPNKLSTLKTIVIGGEICPLHVIQKWCKHVRLVSVYGPTETTVCASILVCNDLLLNRQEQENIIIPIGDAVPNTSIYLVASKDDDEKEEDDSGELVQLTKIGDQGEIYIGGVGVAIGYFGKDDLTRKRFVENTFAKDGSKMYRTGDWGRLLANSEIEFRGRMDNQIKLNGQRIELEEISKQLDLHPLVHQSIVDVKSINGQSTLIAYLILNQQQQQQQQRLQCPHLKEDLTNYLNKKLPIYMIPNHFMVLDKFPINANEKIDRSALPIPTIFISSSSSPSSSHLNQTETKLKQILEGIMLILIRVEDDLISLGLKSIHSIRFIETLRDQGIFITPKIIYTFKSITQISNYIDTSHPNIDQYEEQYSESVANLKSISQLFLNTIINQPQRQSPQLNLGQAQKGYILITGCTGTIGYHIFQNMVISFSDYKLVFLVRDVDRATQLLIQKDQLGFDKDSVLFIQGDLSQPNFNLDQTEYEMLVQGVHYIIHCAAKVNMIMTLDESISDNVEAMKNMIIFSKQCHVLKKLHYMSTMSTILSTSLKWGELQNKGFIQLEEEEPLDCTDSTIIYGGYAQSKWICEYLLINTQLPYTIHRPAMIMDTTNRTTNYLDDFVAICKSIGRYPNLPNFIQTDHTPILAFVKQFLENIIPTTTTTTAHSSIYHYYNSSFPLTSGFIGSQPFPSIQVKEWRKLILNQDYSQFKCSPIGNPLGFIRYLSFLNQDDLKLFTMILFPGNFRFNNNNNKQLQPPS
ncbi:hypothetical protein DFA_09449 [Cavenderia fasciculata]|uniref:Carrier domain-containing protein n=1 Tax=Cavenderia fasciculata TaxID=261658 RepID=F4Q7N2_CACFS|nr:uncharacterized protein DFA_09449 [Cavenderia fasciculata]EGG16414.1 hypothetical protein DFA_09449 [Cavenderia fasciculata]|eukprot:XP_004354798.1 hypothetical protein DFA_09449 [Cavenderia fasciculata]